METRIVFNGKNQVAVESFTPAPVGPGQVGIRTRHSLMSTGTENIVLQRLFENGSHWDKWVKYPFYPGYANVGVIEKLGEGVSDLAVGDLVATRTGHASTVIAGAGSCAKIPSGLDSKAASWFALAKICAMGVRVAQYGLADSVLVIGAGPIGQLSVRWARALGVETILVADRMKERLALARRGGATHVFEESIEKCLEGIKAATGGEGPRVVVDSTGNEAVFVSALAAARRFGRVVVLGDTGAPTGQHLSSDLMMRGLTVVGAHDGHEDPQWNSPIILRYFFNLVASGRFPLEGLITHEFAAKDGVTAYELANTRRQETMGILFNW